MGRVIAFLLLSVGLTAAQDQQTSTIPARVNLDPAVPVYSATTPPNVLTQPAAPGNTSAVVQDYRTATPLVPSGPPAEAIAPSGTTSAPTLGVAESAAETAPRTGVIAYTTAAPAPTSTVSVADAAANYKANKANMKSRVIDNNSLGVLDKNPSGLVTASEMTMPQADISPEDQAALDRAKPEHAAGGDVLDPRDMAAVEAAIRRSQQQQGTTPDAEPRAAAQPDDGYEQMAQSAEAQPDASSSAAASEPRPQAQQSPDSAPPQQSRERLPESSSALPLFAMLGFITLAGGMLSVWRSRG
jgi:hypothetical protein